MTGSCRVVEVEVPCTCGELVQGYLEGEPFLVSCPISRYSRVSVALDPGLFPPGPPKATAAARSTLDSLGHGDTLFSLHVSSLLPASRGFGTSTADVAGAIVAASTATGARLTPMEVAHLAVSVEPSDGTMFTGLAVFNHRSAKNAVPLPAAPPLMLAVLEFEGAVDTLEFNSHLNLDYLRSREDEYAAILWMLRRGLDEQRLEMVGRAATCSARLNQGVLPKPELEQVIDLAERHGALGVCAAHSGTVLGALFAPGEARRANDLAAQARRCLPGLERAWVTPMVDGGARLVTRPGSHIVPAKAEAHAPVRLLSSPSYWSHWPNRAHYLNQEES